MDEKENKQGLFNINIGGSVAGKQVAIGNQIEQIDKGEGEKSENGRTVIQAGNQVTNAQDGGVAIGENQDGPVNQFKINQEIGTVTEGGMVTGAQIGDVVEGDKSGSDVPEAAISTANVGAPSMKLDQKIANYLQKEDILTIIAGLGLDVGRLPGDSLAEKVTQLVDYCSRRGRMDALLRLCEQADPFIKWGE